MFDRRKGVLAVLAVAGALFLGTALGRAAEDQTLEGVISNTHCGLKHSAASADAKGCVTSCIKNGAKYALVVKDKVYTLEGKEADAEKLAGLNAKVTGHVDGTTIHASSIAAGSAAAKM